MLPRIRSRSGRIFNLKSSLSIRNGNAGDNSSTPSHQPPASNNVVSAEGIVAPLFGSERIAATVLKGSVSQPDASSQRNSAMKPAVSCREGSSSPGPTRSLPLGFAEESGKSREKEPAKPEDVPERSPGARSGLDGSETGKKELPGPLNPDSESSGKVPGFDSPSQAQELSARSKEMSPEKSLSGGSSMQSVDTSLSTSSGASWTGMLLSSKRDDLSSGVSASLRHSPEMRATPGRGTYVPDIRDSGDPAALPENLRETGFVKIGESYDARTTCIRYLRKRAEDHVARNGESVTFHRLRDDAFLAAFARCKAFECEYAWEKYFNYCVFYTKHSWLREVDVTPVNLLLDRGAFKVLPTRDREGRVVVSLSYTPFSTIVEEYGSERVVEVLKAIIFLLRTLAFYDVECQVYGCVMVGDLGGYNLRLLSMVGFSDYKMCLNLCQYCLPLRASAFYTQYEPKYVRTVVNTLRVFMKESVRKGFMCCGNSFEKLYSVIAPENLPPVFGGTLEDEWILKDRWLQFVDMLDTDTRSALKQGH